MSKSKRSRKQPDLMDDPIGTMSTLFQMSQGCTMDQAYEQTLQEISDLLNLRPAQPTGFDDADIIRARGMGVVLEFPEL